MSIHYTPTLVSIHYTPSLVSIHYTPSLVNIHYTPSSLLCQLFSSFLLPRFLVRGKYRNKREAFYLEIQNQKSTTIQNQMRKHLFLQKGEQKRVYNPQLMAAKHISTGKRFCAPLPIIFSARKQINTSARLFSWGPTLLNNSLGGNSVYRWDSVS